MRMQDLKNEILRIDYFALIISYFESGKINGQNLRLLSTAILIKEFKEVVYHTNSFTSKICQLTNHSRREDARNYKH